MSYNRPVRSPRNEVPLAEWISRAFNNVGVFVVLSVFGSILTHVTFLLDESILFLLSLLPVGIQCRKLA